MTPLTREYFEKHQQWRTELIEDVDKEFPDFKLWTAHLDHKCDEDDSHCGLVKLTVTNCMYDWRFAIDGQINGSGEGFFQGDIFVTTVEELETLFRIVHLDFYQYTSDFGKDEFKDYSTGNYNIIIDEKN